MMDSTYIPALFRPELPPHCSPTTPFLYHFSSLFHSCVPTPLGFVSNTLGTLSIASWLCAQMPQLYKNYQIKSAAGLSIYFLAEWLMGDLTNLTGALLTKQASWQVIIASYYCFVDCCLVLQYMWYSYLAPQRKEGSLHSSGSSLDGDSSSDVINSLSPINSSFTDRAPDYIKDGDNEGSNPPLTPPIDTPRFSAVNYEKSRYHTSPSSSKNNLSTTTLAGPSPRTVLYAATLSSLVKQATAAPALSFNGLNQSEVRLYGTATNVEIAGLILSWSSTALYTVSRLPQLYKNWRRKSTAGLSPFLFLAAFCGNFFYSSSMLTNPSAWNNFGPYGGHGWADEYGSKRSEWIANAAPFFLGAFGVLFLDATMGAQFLRYGEELDKVVKVRDPNGHSQWRRVSGWMRGWIPSLKKEKVVDLAESQRLLSESREIQRHSHVSQYGST